MNTIGKNILKSGLTIVLCGGIAMGAQWKFGLIADTQWPAAGDSASGYKNPNSVAADIINQVNKEFMAKGSNSS